MRRLMLGTLGAIAIAIMSQGTMFAAEEEAEEDMAVVITPQTQSSTTGPTTPQLLRSTTGPHTSSGTTQSNQSLSNQNHSE